MVTTRKSIVIADDEPGVRALIQSTLDDDELDIFLAADGDQALALGLEHRPDLVILDLVMPGMDGAEVCQRLRSNPDTAGAVVIILTGWGGEADRRRVFAAGADSFLIKPFSPMALQETVSAALHRE